MEKLTNEELVELYQSDNNEFAFEELYKKNKGLIYNVCLRFKNTAIITKEDIKSACDLGFVRAAKSYSNDNNCKFSSYCHVVMVNEVNTNINTARRQKRDSSNHLFYCLDEKVNEEEGSKLVDILNTSDNDVLHKSDYTYLHNAIEYAKTSINEKYHQYLLPLMFRETTTNEVALIIGVSPRTVHYTTTMFREHVREYIYHYSEGEIVS